MAKKNSIIENIRKNTPLEIRVKVDIESHFIANHGGTFFMPLDENGNDIPEAVEANRKCYEMAQPLLDSVLKEIKQWKLDGCPE